MADTRPTATTTTAKASSTSVQAKKSSNAISWLAPIICIVAGYIIWRFLMGDPSGFKTPGTGGFWPTHKNPKDAFHRIYEGGIIVPLLIGMFLMVITFSIKGRVFYVNNSVNQMLGMQKVSLKYYLLLIILKKVFKCR